MKPKTLWITTLLAGALAGMGLAVAATRLTPAALAAPASVATAASPAGALAEMLAGKTYPLTLKAEQIDASYHLVGLVDAQGQSSVYATRGETLSTGGETFLVCYSVATTNSPIRAPQPKAGATANLIYINMHAVEAVGGIIAIAPPETAAPAAALP